MVEKLTSLTLHYFVVITKYFSKHPVNEKHWHIKLNLYDKLLLKIQIVRVKSCPTLIVLTNPEWG